MSNPPGYVASSIKRDDAETRQAAAKLDEERNKDQTIVNNEASACAQNLWTCESEANRVSRKDLCKNNLNAHSNCHNVCFLNKVECANGIATFCGSKTFEQQKTFPICSEMNSKEESKRNIAALEAANAAKKVENDNLIARIKAAEKIKADAAAAEFTKALTNVHSGIFASKRVPCDNLQNIDMMVLDPTCADYKDDIIQKKCTVNSDSFNTNTCQTYCSNIPEYCQASFKDFCSKTENKQACLNFCNKKNNKSACLKMITNSCNDKQIITDVFCQNTASLVNSNMLNNYDLVMNNYCNNEGKQKDLKNIGNLENPACACYDKNLINAKFSYLKDNYLRKALISSPECYYDKCKDNPNAYKKMNYDCTISVCDEDVNRIKNLKNIDIQIKNPNECTNI
jgi:hypothetical protein